MYADILGVFLLIELNYILWIPFWNAAESL